MAIHIGNIINLIASKKGYKTQKAFGEAIHTSQQNVADIYQRENIDTGLLKDIAAVLDYDFLKEYYKEEPFKRFKNREEKVWLDKILALESEIARLKELQVQMQDHINTQKAYIDDLKKNKKAK